MASLFGAQVPTVAAPTPAPPAPDRSSAEVTALGAAQRARFYGAQSGRAATELTGGTGTDKPSAVVRLLGGIGR